jgi:tetratricopeptide (TPR) repeat protein
MPAAEPNLPQALRCGAPRTTTWLEPCCGEPDAGRHEGYLRAMLTFKHLALSGALAGLLAGCAKPAAPPAPPTTPPPQAVVEPAPPPAAPEAPVGPASPAAQQQAQKSALMAVELLESGYEDQARTELQRALISDANNKLAHSLLRQLSVDPVAALGRESFSYVVKPGESLSGIAKRYMGDVYSFYILARYNDIKVPRQLAGGQAIRIPGKAPPPQPVAQERDTRRVEAPATRADARPATSPALSDGAAVPLPMPTPVVATPAASAEAAAPSPSERALRLAEAAERSGDLDRAFTEYRRATDQPGAPEKAEQVRKQLIARHTVSARTAFAKQDLDGTIGQWDRVLELDPNNETAKLERRKAVGLKEKLQAK